jgi:hypothetical protein
VSALELVAVASRPVLDGGIPDDASVVGVVAEHVAGESQDGHRMRGGPVVELDRLGALDGRHVLDLSHRISSSVQLPGAFWAALRASGRVT